MTRFSIFPAVVAACLLAMWPAAAFAQEDASIAVPVTTRLSSDSKAGNEAVADDEAKPKRKAKDASEAKPRRKPARKPRKAAETSAPMDAMVQPDAPGISAVPETQPQPTRVPLFGPAKPKPKLRKFQGAQEVTEPAPDASGASGALPPPAATPVGIR